MERPKQHIQNLFERKKISSSTRRHLLIPSDFFLFLLTSLRYEIPSAPFPPKTLPKQSCTPPILYSCNARRNNRFNHPWYYRNKLKCNCDRSHYKMAASGGIFHFVTANTLAGRRNNQSFSYLYNL